MKLRNKKTGKVVEALISAYWISGDVAVSEMDSNAESGYTDLGRYKTLAELNEEWEDYEPEPDPSFLIVKIQQLENSVKALDERLKAHTEKMDTLRDGINELHNRLKTVEEKNGAHVTKTASEACRSCARRKTKE